MTIDLYGLKNCDGCRKATKALQAQGVEVVFHDIRDSENTARVVKWIAQHTDPMVFVNRRSTTWRQLAPQERDNIDQTRALRLLEEHPTLIKRPVLRIGSSTLAGFDEAAVTLAMKS